MGKTGWYVGCLQWGFNTALADDDRGLIELDAIDETCFEKKSRSLCTAFDQK